MEFFKPGPLKSYGFSEGSADLSLSRDKEGFAWLAKWKPLSASARNDQRPELLSSNYRHSHHQRSRPPAAFTNPRTPMPPSQMITLPVAVEELLGEASRTYDPV